MYFLIDHDVIVDLYNNGLIEWIDPSSSPDGFLYAYTNKKKLAKLFESQRNEKVFYKKIVDMEEDEFEKMENVNSRYTKIRMEFINFDDDQFIYVPMTASEHWYACECTREIITDFLDKLPKIDSSIFRLDIYETLRDLGYNNAVTHVDELHEGELLNDVADYTYHKAWRNQFGTFLFFYQNIIDSYELMRLRNEQAEIETS
jgi:hypothetical protein